MIVSQRPWLIAGLIAILYLVVLFPTPEFPVYNSDDGSYFVTLALNLVQHGRYTTDTFVGSPYGHHATWPPLFPLTLAGIVGVWGLSWVAIKAGMAILGLAGLYLWRRLFRQEAFGPAAILATALTPIYFLYAHHPMAEVPFMLLCAATLLALRQATTPLWALAAGVLAAAAFFTRGYAAAFLPAALLWFALAPGWTWRQRARLAVAFAIPMTAAILGWHSYTAHIVASQPLDTITTRFGTGTGLLSGFLLPPLTHLKNLYWFELRYPLHFVAPWLPLHSVLAHPVLFIVSACLSALMFVGWGSRLRAALRPEDIWVPCTALLLYGAAAASSAHAVRYWLVLLPFGLLYLFTGTAVLGRLLKAPAVPRAAVAALTASIAVGLGVHFWQPDRLRFADSTWREYRDLAVWARENLPAGAAVIAPTSHKFHAVSGLTVYPGERSETPPVNHAPLYVVCGRADWITATHRKRCAKIVADERPLHHVGGFAIYRLDAASQSKDQALARAGRKS